MDKREFLIARRDSGGTGKVLTAVRARSKEEILARLPGADVLDPPPPWMTDEQRAKVGSVVVYDIDEPLDVRLLADAGAEPPPFDPKDLPPDATVVRGPDALQAARIMFGERH